MHSLKNLIDKISLQPLLLRQSVNLTQNLLPTVRLEHRYIIALLVVANLLGEPHSACEHIYNLDINIINPATQLIDTLPILAILSIVTPYHEGIEHLFKIRRYKLLFCIAQRHIG